MSAIRAMFRRRAVADESVPDYHHTVMIGLNEVLAPTAAAVDISRVYFEQARDGSSGAADLTPAFRSSSFQGAISYCPRKAITADHGMFDDVLTLVIPRSSDLYSAFVRDAFLQISKVFGAYRAGVYLDEDLDLDDFDQIVELSQRTGSDPDGRDGVFRVAPVCLFDHELCIRAFHRTPEEVVVRAIPHAEVARVVDDKAYLVITSELVDRDELIAIDRRIRIALVE